jgi:hypothetical protein
MELINIFNFLKYSLIYIMVNSWRDHVKKTMEEMKKSVSKGETIMLKDVLKKAKSTYKKIEKIEDKKHHKKTAKKHNSKGKGKKKGKTYKKRK